MSLDRRHRESCSLFHDLDPSYVDTVKTRLSQARRDGWIAPTAVYTERHTERHTAAKGERRLAITTATGYPKKGNGSCIGLGPRIGQELTGLIGQNLDWTATVKKLTSELVIVEIEHMDDEIDAVSNALLNALRHCEAIESIDMTSVDAATSMNICHDVIRPTYRIRSSTLNRATSTRAIAG